MSVIDDNVIDMEKEHMKKVILDLSRKHGISPSQLAQEAGIAPSTITGFLNDREGRAKHGLSAQTQSKLEKTYPEESINTLSSSEVFLLLLGSLNFIFLNTEMFSFFDLLLY